MTLYRTAKLALPERLKPIAVSLAVAFMGLSAQAQTPEPASAPAAAVAPAERDPKALEVLGNVGKYLRTLKSFTINVESTKDEVLDNGQKVQFATSATYRAKTPDKLRVDITGERQLRQFYFNGKTLTQYAPRVNYYASIDATGSIKDVLARASDKYDIEIPLADLFFWGADAPTA